MTRPRLPQPLRAARIAWHRRRARRRVVTLWTRRLLRAGGLTLGIAIFGLLLFSHYDRAVSVSGRTEVIAVRSDGSDFSNWTLPDASVRGGDAGVTTGPVSIELEDGTEARFVRRGQGPLSISFTAKEPNGPPCDKLGKISVGEAPAQPLCEDARVIVPAPRDGAPLVVSLRGNIAMGEEVRAGAGAQPILLEGEAQLLVRHGGLFTWICKGPGLSGLCDRFVGMRLTLSPGDALRFMHREKDAVATGFLRLDPAEYNSGLRFDAAAANAALDIRRMKGDTIELSESIFDRLAKSPVFQSVSAALGTLSLIWLFVRSPRGGGGGSSEASIVVAIALSASLLLPSGGALAQQALVRSGELGQALLRSRADRCYAVTPRHVLGGEGEASLVLERRVLADADVLRFVPAAPEPMAILITRAVPPELCPAFLAGGGLDGVLRARAGAVLRLLRPDGSFDRVPLSVLSVDVETFEVQPGGDALQQGMSGGTVLIDDQPVGLLTDVRDEGRIGRVARLDRVFERLEPYLGAGLVPPAAAPAAVGEGQVPLTVVRWTAEAVSPANRADGLVTPGAAPWRVADPAADVVFKLGVERAVLSGVRVDASGLKDPPRTLEVLLGSSERGPWRSVASFALESGDGARQAMVPPTRAGFVMLRARQHQAGVTTMGLTRFGLLTAP